MKKILLIILIFFAFINSILAKTIDLENEYIKIIADKNTGQFMIKSIEEGKINTRKKINLLYESDPPNSFTTIKIDDECYIFGSDDGKFLRKVNQREDELITVWKIKDIIVTQILKFVIGTTTGNKDTIEISYNIKNNSKKIHAIGVRIMLDTYLGQEDGAPFRIPDIGPILKETAFSNKNIPEYWYTYDDLIQPKVRAQGTLKTKNTAPPDKVVFACCIRFMQHNWNFTIDNKRSFRRTDSDRQDSAISIYWNQRKLLPNREFNMSTQYGLYGATIAKGKIFNVSLSSPYKVIDEPFIISAEMQNKSDYKTDNIIASVILPDKLKLYNDDSAIKNIRALKPKEMYRISWNVIADKNLKSNLDTDIISYKVKISGNVKDKKKKIYPEIIPERKIILLKKKPEPVKTVKKESPEKITKRKTTGIMIEFNNVLFDYKSSSLTPKAKKEIDKIGETLKQYIVYNLIIKGHTDNIGSQNYNMNLSEERAKEVIKYLIDNGYINKAQGLYQGFGKDLPVADNFTEEGRMKNCRVEILFIGSEK